MRVPRLHAPVPLRPRETVDLDATAARHVRNVLRLREGAAVVLFDGAGSAHDATLTRLTRDRVTVEVGASRVEDMESPLRVTVALGVSRGERMDFALQKAVELGVHAVCPLTTERTVVRLDAQRAARREAHWRGILVGACEQSGRNRIPDLAPVTRLDTWLRDGPAHGHRLVLDPRTGNTLRSIGAAPDDGVTLLIGPEGGLAEAERDLAREHGFVPVGLGPRVLRTETAVIAALTAVMTLWGDLGG